MPADACPLRPRREMALRRFAAPGAALRCGILAKDRPDDDFADIVSDDYVAVWILRGGGIYRDAAAGTIAVAAGDLVQRLPGHRHATIGDAARDWLELFVVLPPGLFHSLASLGVLDGTAPVLRPGIDRRLALDGERLIATAAGADEAAWPGLLIQATALVVALTDLHRRRAAGGDRDGPALREACRLLAADLARPLAPAAVARQVGLGHERFRKLFRARLGVSPAAWRRRRRIDAACAMLLAERLPPAEVARRLGWPDVFAFTRQFARAVGQPPARWRRGVR